MTERSFRIYLFSSLIVLLCSISFFVQPQQDQKKILQTRDPHKRVLLIGAGGKKAKEYFEVLKEHVNFVGFIQPNPRSDILALSQKEKISLYEDLDACTKEVDFDGAILVVPHHLHFSYASKLLKAGKFVIKDKPIAINTNDTKSYRSLSVTHPLPFFTIVQRQFQQSFIEAKKELKTLGRIYSFKYEYNLKLKGDTLGWRAQKSLSGGGALLDMGYHAVDVITSYFGMPLTTNAQCSYKAAASKPEGLEDEAFMLFSYPNDLVGTLSISRYGAQKKESFEISGEHGIIVISPRDYMVYDTQGALIKHVESRSSKEEETVSMFLTYLSKINDHDYIEHEFNRHHGNIELIEKIYRQH